jgi:LTXXQ motif family protein
MASPRSRPAVVSRAERRDLRRMDRAQRGAVLRERAAQQQTVARDRAAERLQQRQNAATSRLERLQQRAERGRLGRAERREMQRLERVQRQQVAPSTAARDQSQRATRATRVTPQQVNQGRFASSFTASADPSWRRSDRRAQRLAPRAAWRLGVLASFVPWRGPVYWPYAYSDIFHYAFWPDAYEPSYWAYAYDDFYDGIFFPDGAPHVDYAYPGPYQAFTIRDTSIRDSRPAPRGAVTPGRLSEATRAFCAEQARGVSAWPFEEIARAVQPINDQKELLADLRKAAAEAAAQLRDACPDAVPLTPAGRIEAMTLRFDAMLGAIRIVRPALVAFYESLTDEQKARFNELGPDLERQPRTATAQINCKDGKAGVTGLTLERIEAIVQPTQAQEAALAPLRDAIEKSEQRLNAVCAAATPQTPVGRLDAMQQRIETLLAAANDIRPALEAFYASLDSEQKAKFNRLSRVAER